LKKSRKWKEENPEKKREHDKKYYWKKGMRK
jgi:hypothetical protein